MSGVQVVADGNPRQGGMSEDERDQCIHGGAAIEWLDVTQERNSDSDEHRYCELVPAQGQARQLQGDECWSVFILLLLHRQPPEHANNEVCRQLQRLRRWRRHSGWKSRRFVVTYMLLKCGSSCAYLLYAGVEQLAVQAKRRHLVRRLYCRYFLHFQRYRLVRMTNLHQWLRTISPFQPMYELFKYSTEFTTESDFLHISFRASSIPLRCWVKSRDGNRRSSRLRQMWMVPR